MREPPNTGSEMTQHFNQTLTSHAHQVVKHLPLNPFYIYVCVCVCVCFEENPHIGNPQPIQISKTQHEKNNRKLILIL
jgi:hypothetical protein